MSPELQPPAPGAWSAWAALAASSSTLVCCALPAALTALGAGAALSSLVSAVPQLVVLSEHKKIVFVATALMLAAAGWLQWRGKSAPCPVDPGLRRACQRTRRWSAASYGVSVAVFATGAWFAFVQPRLMGAMCYPYL